jgi:hypothetical protein
MSKLQLPRPTDAELAILRVLWASGPATVRQVNAVLNETRETSYTTTLKFMQIMAEKGLVTARLRTNAWYPPGSPAMRRSASWCPIWCSARLVAQRPRSCSRH